MKTLLLSVTCAALTTISAHAEIFRPDTARNMIIGGIAGAIIGDHNDHAAEGAVIGAAAGYLFTAATDSRRGYCEPAVPVYCEPRRPARVVVVEPPRCPPPVRRVVVVERPAPRPCPPPPVVIYRDGRRYDSHSRVVYVAPADRCEPRERVIVERPYWR